MKEKLALLGVGIGAIVILIDNYTAGKKIEVLRKNNELLALQNQGLRYILVAVDDPNVSASEFVKEINTRASFINIVANEL